MQFSIVVMLDEAVASSQTQTERVIIEGFLVVWHPGYVARPNPRHLVRIGPNRLRPSVHPILESRLQHGRRQPGCAGLRSVSFRLQREFLTVRVGETMQIYPQERFVLQKLPPSDFQHELAKLLLHTLVPERRVQLVPRRAKGGRIVFVHHPLRNHLPLSVDHTLFRPIENGRFQAKDGHAPFLPGRLQVLLNEAEVVDILRRVQVVPRQRFSNMRNQRVIDCVEVEEARIRPRLHPGGETPVLSVLNHHRGANRRDGRNAPAERDRAEPAKFSGDR